MSVSMMDTHAHLDASEFENDLADVINRAHEAGVDMIATVGMGLKSCRQSITIAENNPGIVVIAGFHPHQADSVTRDDIKALAELVRHEKVVAIGEIGLDFHRNYSAQDKQYQSLRWQLELVTETGLPVVVHCRDAHEEMLKVLREWKAAQGNASRQSTGIIHCFSGDTDTANQYLELGFHLSLAAYIGYPSSRYAHDTIRAIPSDRLLVETDCPFFAPQRIRGKRCEPAHVRDTVAELATIRGVPFETIARQTMENARAVYRL